MAKNLRRMIAPLAILMIATAVIGYRGGAFGVPADKLERFSRDHQPIPEEWLCIQSARDDIVALLFYPEDQSNASYVIYAKGTGLSFGFHPRSRGFMHSIQEGICEYQYGDRGAAIFLSLNQANVARAEIEYEEGAREQIIIDAGEPFALIAPLSAAVTFYDTEGGAVEELRTVVAI